MKTDNPKLVMEEMSDKNVMHHISCIKCIGIAHEIKEKAKSLKPN